MKHNNMIANEHFRKYWQRYVKTWFDQPAKKKARRLARQKKAAAVAPRPVAGALRSVVHPPTQRYNSKVRIGRGFSLAEIKVSSIIYFIRPGGASYNVWVTPGTRQEIVPGAAL